MFKVILFSILCWLVHANCVDSTDGAVDSFRGNCTFYVQFPSQCGFHDDTDFVANEMCCSCGGGGSDKDNVPVVPACTDTDNGAVDVFGHSCDFYISFPERCGSADNDLFTSREFCCSCDGGQISASNSENQNVNDCKTGKYLNNACYLHNNREKCIQTKEIRNFQLQNGNNIKDSPCAWCDNSICHSDYGNKCEPLVLLFEAEQEYLPLKKEIEFCAFYDDSTNIPQNRYFLTDEFYLRPGRGNRWLTNKDCINNAENGGVGLWWLVFIGFTIAYCCPILCCWVCVLGVAGNEIEKSDDCEGAGGVFICFCIAGILMQPWIFSMTFFSQDYTYCNKLEKLHPPQEGFNTFIIRLDETITTTTTMINTLYPVEPSDDSDNSNEFTTMSTTSFPGDYLSDGKCTIMDDPWPSHRRNLVNYASLGNKLYKTMGFISEAHSVQQLTWLFFDLFQDSTNDNVPIRCETDMAVACFYWLSCAECVMAFDQNIFTGKEELETSDSQNCKVWYNSMETFENTPNCFANVCEAACPAKFCSNNACWFYYDECHVYLAASSLQISIVLILLIVLTSHF